MSANPGLIPAAVRKSPVQKNGKSHLEEKDLSMVSLVQHRFVQPGEDPFSKFTWVKRNAVITNGKGKEVFRQDNVEFPDFFSQESINIVVSRYFRGALGAPERETSFRQVVFRVVDTITTWALMQGYLNETNQQTFSNELKFLLTDQYASFNSPVWFNLGVAGVHQQASACFIQSVDDSLDSILELVKKEGMVFKGGSGSGTNYSKLRSSYEQLSGGGHSSGVMSFLNIFDTAAGSIKSGGKTRRAAKMDILNVDHPDILEQRDGSTGFIGWKSHEEKKAKILEAGGYGGGIEGEATRTVQGQNANNSVRVTDAFMQAVVNDGDWSTRYVTTGKPCKTYKAREIWNAIAEAAWQCGDPGLQYDDTINNWHTCLNTDRIKASNPCSEYMFLDDSACNLASLNLLKFKTADGDFDTETFEHVVEVMTLAMESIVSKAYYPVANPMLAKNSEDYRPLGLGFGNLGALLMSWGIPYDSEEGRGVAGSVASLLCGRAYARSAELASINGPFTGYVGNQEPMNKVVKKHASAHSEIMKGKLVDQRIAAIISAGFQAWKDCLELGELFGYRNAQATNLAPTGTISFMMGMDTTGGEPYPGLVIYKNTVGGGYHKLPISILENSLRGMGYGQSAIDEIVTYVGENDTVEGCKALKGEHLPVFDCALPTAKGQRTISVDGHLLMMAAIQPFMSGAISKTVNLPGTATVEDIAETYLKGWKLGLKSVALYRDGSKLSQPLEAKAKEKVRSRSERERLTEQRPMVARKFSIGGTKGHFMVGLYPDGRPGELFVEIAKEGSTVGGLADGFARLFSTSLQHGVPLQALLKQMRHAHFEPAGMVMAKEAKLTFAESIYDLMAKWFELYFPNGVYEPNATAGDSHLAVVEALPSAQHSGKTCGECGGMLVASGSCFACKQCGQTTGCS